MFAVYIVVTIFGGVVLVVFLILMGILFWMNAPFKLPEAYLVHPKATAFVHVHLDPVESGTRANPEGLADFLCDGAPPQVRNLLAKGIRNPKCPVRVTASVYPGPDGSRIWLAASLGRYPGQFRLVRRDLERRVKKQSLPASVTYHAGKALFLIERAPSPFKVLCLARCTVLRASEAAGARDLLDQMIAKDKTHIHAISWPSLPGDSTGCLRFFGYIEQWQPGILAQLPSFGSRAAFCALLGDLAKDMPAVAGLRHILFNGRYRPDGLTELRFEVGVPEEQGSAPETAKRLAQWLKEKGKTVGIVSVEAKEHPNFIELMITIKPAEG